MYETNHYMLIMPNKKYKNKIMSYTIYNNKMKFIYLKYL